MLPTHVIFADGNRDLRNTVRGNFAALGFPTFLAADRHEAIGFAQSTRARLVLLDYRLAPSNGLEACERIRELPDYSDVPILLMAHSDVARLRLKAHKSGVSALVFKPFSVRTLLREIEPFLLDPDWLATRALQNDVAGGPPVTPPGFSETAMVWRPPSAPQRTYPEGSHLTQGKLALDVYRQAAAPTTESRRPSWPRKR